MTSFDAVIISGGALQKDTAGSILKQMDLEYGRKSYCLIAADHGLDHCLDLGYIPDAAVGDFDSASPETIEKLRELEKGYGMSVVRLKPEKDDSDTQSALNLAIGGGAKSILLLGCFGTRMDHMIANMELLLFARQQGVCAVLADRYNYMVLLERKTVLFRKDQPGENISFFPVGGEVEGLTLQGFYYPLQDYCLKTSDCGLTVSNIITEEKACVTYQSGYLLMIQTSDDRIRERKI